MTRGSLFLAALAVLSHPATAAGNDKVARGPLPAWVTISDPLPVPAGAAGLVFVRQNDQLLHFDGKGQEGYQGFRIKILHPNALQIGNLSLGWNPAAGAPVVHAVKIYRAGSVIDVLASSDFEILRREDQLEAARLDGNLTAVLRVPDLRVGDELEFAVTIRNNDPTLGATSAGILALPAETAPGQYRLGLDWTAGQEPTLKLSDDLAAAAKRSGDRLTISLTNPPPAVLPKDAPVRFGWVRVLEFSDFADWPAVSRQFAPLFTAAAKLGPASPISEEARKIAAASPSQAARVAAALKLVQQDVRYVYVGLNGGNYRPASADETWARRYGDCKGKTALLLALLAELGIQAEAVLANNGSGGDGTDLRLPSPALFDHVLVRATVDGRTLWLDGTLPTAATPSSEPALPYRWVLPLSASGRPLESLPWKPATVPDEITLWDMDAREGFDKPARITGTFVLRGLKGLQQFAALSALTPAQLLSGIRQEMVGSTWQTIDRAEWRFDPTTRASIMTVIGQGAIDWDRDGAERSLSLPGGGFSPPERRVRPADQNQKLPYANTAEYSCHVTTVRLPTGTKAAQWSTNSQFDTRMFGRNYYRAFDRDGDTVSMVRGSRIEQLEITADEAARDNDRIGSFDNSMAWLSFDPTAAGGASAASAAASARSSAGSKVPAIGSFNWTGAAVPCTSRATSFASGNR